MQAAQPLVPLYTVALGGSPLAVGFIAAATAVIPIALAVLVGAVADSVGPMVVGTWAARILVGVLVALSLSTHLWQVALTMLVVGLADVGVVIGTQATIAYLSRPEERDGNFRSFFIFVAVGSLFGPVLGGLVANDYGFRYAFLTAALPAALAAEAIRRVRRLPAQAYALPREHDKLCSVVAVPGMVPYLFASGAVMFSFALRFSFYPIYFSEAGMSTVGTTSLIALQSLGAVLTRPLIGRMGVPFENVRLWRLGAIMMTAGIAVTPLVTHAGLLAIISTMIGVATGFTQPMSMSVISAAAPDRSRGKALGLRVNAMMLGYLASGVLGGATASIFGLPAVFALAAIITGLGAMVLHGWLGRMPR